MTSLAILLVTASGLAHSVWNLLAKKSRDKAVFLWLIFSFTTIPLLPYLVWELIHLDGGWVTLVLSFAFQAAYGLLLSLSYREGDMSQVYPIMRGTGMFLVPLLGMLIWHESLSVWGWLALLIMLLCFFSLSGWPAPGRRVAMRPVLLALGVGLCTAGYVTMDKFNLQHLSALSLLALGNLGVMAALTPAALRKGKLRAEWTGRWKQTLAGAVLSPGSYLLFLLAIPYAPIGLISPIRECGTVFAAIFGVLLLKESQGFRRIVSSAVMAAAIVTVALWG